MSDIKAEPVAWLHTQGNFHAAYMRELDEWEKKRGWTQQPLYTADAIRQAVLAERERAAKVCEESIGAETVDEWLTGWNTALRDAAAAVEAECKPREIDACMLVRWLQKYNHLEAAAKINRYVRGEDA